MEIPVKKILAFEFESYTIVSKGPPLRIEK
jgi:hypothetical protein